MRFMRALGWRYPCGIASGMVSLTLNDALQLFKMIKWMQHRIQFKGNVCAGNAVAQFRSSDIGLRLALDVDADAGGALVQLCEEPRKLHVRHSVKADLVRDGS